MELSQIGKLCCMFLLHDDASGAHSDPGFYRRLEGLLVPELRRLAAGLLEQASASDKAYEYSHTHPIMHHTDITPLLAASIWLNFPCSFALLVSIC